MIQDPTTAFFEMDQPKWTSAFREVTGITTGNSRILVHSRSSFLLNTCGSSGMERSCGLRAMGRTVDQQVLVVIATLKGRSSIIHRRGCNKNLVSSIGAGG